MGVDAALTSIAENLHERRIRAGLTLDQLAQRTDLSTAHLSRIESGDRQPSVAALISLARALRVPVGVLLGEGKEGPAIAVYSNGEPTHEASGLTVANCGGFPGSSTIEALRITIEPDRVPPAPSRHRGEEWIYVLSGCLRLEFDGDVRTLESGSAVHFDAERPHRLGAVGLTTEVLVVAADAPVESTTRVFTSEITVH
ncbi:MAG: helix-turn-helix domain-containing protein [Acidimicrobiales bacterium]|jgi:transcriptional regulator with XRE-family HTH domain